MEALEVFSFLSVERLCWEALLPVYINQVKVFLLFCGLISALTSNQNSLYFDFSFCERRMKESFNEVEVIEIFNTATSKILRIEPAML
jgi:hypothetical protein